MGTNLRRRCSWRRPPRRICARLSGLIVNMIDIHAQRPLPRIPSTRRPRRACMLTRSLARELAPEVRVNGIAPGPILWPEGGMDETLKDEIVSRRCSSAAAHRTTSCAPRCSSRTGCAVRHRPDSGGRRRSERGLVTAWRLIACEAVVHATTSHSSRIVVSNVGCTQLRRDVGHRLEHVGARTRSGRGSDQSRLVADSAHRTAGCRDPSCAAPISARSAADRTRLRSPAAARALAATAHRCESRPRD